MKDTIAIYDYPKKIIIFGTGAYYKKHKDIALKKDNVLFIADNNPKKQGTILDGVKVISPIEILNVEYDYVVLMVSNASAIEIKKQLGLLGVSDKKILCWEEYSASRCAGEYQIYAPSTPKKIAIVTGVLDFTGGPIAVINAARAALNQRSSVTIVATEANLKLVEEVNALGITVVVYPAFCNMGKLEIDWIKQFDFVLVNTFPKIDCALKIFNVVPMFLWLHEPGIFYKLYEQNLFKYKSFLDDNRVCEIPTFAVSDIARRGFLENFHNNNVGILPYCVKDETFNVVKRIVQKRKKVTFAVVAAYVEHKQQNLFLEAASRIEQEHSGKYNFLLIGKYDNSAYSKKIIEMAHANHSVEVKGVLSREEMNDAYENEIDVVVCPSLEETMSLTITEGMMHSKLCICSDNTGMAEYINDGENGFICKAGDVESLYEKMLYCAMHFDELDFVRLNARKTYEDNFTMDIFGKRIDNIIHNIMDE